MEAPLQRCFLYLHQSLKCAADTALEPAGNAVNGFGNRHMCRSYDKVFEWAELFRYSDDIGI